MAKKLKERIKIQEENTTLIIGCADNRLKGTKAKEWIKENLKVNGNPIVVYWPGAIHDFIGTLPIIREFLWGRISLLVEEKNIKRVIIWQHGNCLAYARYNLSPEGESKKQIRDMIMAEAILKKKFPQLEVMLLYAKLLGKNFQFEIVDAGL